MTPRDYAILKRKKVLPLRATLWMYALLLNRRANESGNIPYWFSLLLGLVFWVVLFLIAVVSYPVNVPAQALKVNTVFSFTIIIQLLASEAVNRKVIHSLSHRIVPPVMEKEIWTKMDASIREQLLIPLAGVAIGFPLVLLYAKVLFPGFNIDAAFIFGLAVVLFGGGPFFFFLAYRSFFHCGARQFSAVWLDIPHSEQPVSAVREDSAASVEGLVLILFFFDSEERDSSKANCCLK